MNFLHAQGLESRTLLKQYQTAYHLNQSLDSLETHVSPHQDAAASGFHRWGFLLSTHDLPLGTSEILVLYVTWSKTVFDEASASDSVSDFERQLQELFNEVRTLITTGNEKDAVDLLQANYEGVKERMNAGSKGMEEAAILDVIALGYMLNVCSSNNSVFLVTPLSGMAKVLSSTAKATQAVDIYHRVIHILELSRGVASEDLIVPLFGLGSLLMKESKVTGAEDAFIRGGFGLFGFDSDPTRKGRGQVTRAAQEGFEDSRGRDSNGSYLGQNKMQSLRRERMPSSLTVVAEWSIDRRPDLIISSRFCIKSFTWSNRAPAVFIDDVQANSCTLENSLCSRGAVPPC
ncbi:hypothetical protein F3Y22_tig00013960pilonHSYRG00101 [Hibiscus syriacus]|uniref:Uncharacterized protein n=1 Tax=Hibiscus syriacus TaxID=106335 RepID=A0A6A3C0W8_HIBSY|nr:hypothetical protein F3Y22_tig00013960pilonHSYRG00101 [Hibiscus syriacus]